MKIKTKYIVLITIVVIYVLLQIVPYNKNKKDNPFIRHNDDRPLIIAHGGAKEMNPENTWMAYDFAYDYGADVFEMDLCLTKDNILITHHNASIDATSNGSGLVRDYTYEEISQFNFGANFTDFNGNSPYASLSDEELSAYGKALSPANIDELFAKYGNKVLYIIELKDVGEDGKIAADKLLELLIKYNLQDYVCVASFDKETLSYFNSIKGDIITSLDFSTSTNFIIANYLGYGLFTNYEGSGLQLPYSEYNIPLATKYLIYKIHKNDMFVHYWTINTKEEMRTCIKNGADGIITDRLDLLKEVLTEMGY